MPFFFSTRVKADGKTAVNISYEFNLLVHFLPLRARTSWLIPNGEAAGTILQSVQ